MCVMTLSVKQEVKITLVKSRLITLQSIIYQPEEKTYCIEQAPSF